MTTRRDQSLPGSAGLRLAAGGWGPPSGLPVLLLPGGGQTRHAWDPTARRLGAVGFHAVTADLRGHGQSDWANDGDYSLDAIAADVVAATASLAVRPVVVGASLGGIAALLAQAAQPRSARAIVLVDIAPSIEGDGVARILQFMKSRPDGFASVEEAAEAVAGYLPGSAPGRLDGLARNLRRQSDGRYRWHWDPALLDAGIVESLSPERLEAAARTLDIPTLLIRGSASDVLTEAGVAAFVDAVPHAEVHCVANAGHTVAGADNDPFGEAIVAFLGRVLAGRPIDMGPRQGAR